MSPFDVHFSQSSISYSFRDGTTIDELAQALKSGQVNPQDVPPLRLLEKNGVYFTLDNRRLEAFRRAKLEIPWRLATGEEIAAESHQERGPTGDCSLCRLFRTFLVVRHLVRLFHQPAFWHPYCYLTGRVSGTDPSEQGPKRGVP